MNKSYLTLLEISEIIQNEEPNIYEEFYKLEDSKKQYAAQRATFKIENLGIVNKSKKVGELTFPLLYQNGILGFDIQLCVALETLYIALNKRSEEIKLSQLGVVSKSDKSASVTFDKGLVTSLKNCEFNNLKAYNFIKKYIPKSFNMR
ncbi:hypothetical protein H3N56_03075 [Cetobacterium sp. 2A]|uniref:hypothetical protein n=1 Tax=Cetobacterium sp. 2A TaxID=2754723 RepID=UPI00163CCCC2|nr:hypothetical protein [Cetobacterium sp. 2A]MBC2855477.1 hypothetical protein [Cetobacterium sp. 2A]